MGRRNKRARTDAGGGGGDAVNNNNDKNNRDGHALTVVEEGAVKCVCASQHAKLPGSTPGFFNPVMRVNRDMSVCAVAAAAKSHPTDLPPMRCLDAFAASGVLGLRWAVEASSAAAAASLANAAGNDERVGMLDVVLNDASGRCAAMAAVNAKAAAEAKTTTTTTTTATTRETTMTETTATAAATAATAAAPRGGDGPDPADVPPPTDTPDDGPNPEPRTYRFLHPAAPAAATPPSSAPPSSTAAAAAAAAATVTVTRRMAGALLHEEPFNFIHLDPFGGAPPHLDAALSRAPHGGYLSVTSTDTAALYGIYPSVARRHYGAETGGGPAGAGNPARRGVVHSLHHTTVKVTFTSTLSSQATTSLAIIKCLHRRL